MWPARVCCKISVILLFDSDSSIEVNRNISVAFSGLLSGNPLT
jgi:hypothetical protein